MNKWQAVFFDFDGVILDSVGVKTEAFAKMFREYGTNIEKQVTEYHLKNGGMSRYEKFKYYYRDLLHHDLSDVEMKRLDQEFNALVIHGVLEAPFIPGALESLNQTKIEGIPTFIVSGTPDKEIKEIVLRRGLDKYFREIHGSPEGKDAIVKDILNRWKFNPSETLFIGDAITDLVAAQYNKVNFLGINSKGQQESLFSKEVIVKDSVTLVI